MQFLRHVGFLDYMNAAPRYCMEGWAAYLGMPRQLALCLQRICFVNTKIPIKPCHNTTLLQWFMLAQMESLGGGLFVLLRVDFSVISISILSETRCACHTKGVGIQQSADDTSSYPGFVLSLGVLSPNLQQCAPSSNLTFWLFRESRLQSEIHMMTSS